MVTTITPTIVTVNVTVTEAPEPSQLQQSGAIVSTGGTTLAADTFQYCGSLAAVQAIQAAPVAITSLAWASSAVTATVPTMTLAVGQTFTTTIAGASAAGYNGTFTATVASTTTFTYPLTANPGTETTPGTYTPPGSAFLSNSATTFFAQGSSVGVYVLELGPQATAGAAITALQTWITGNSAPQVFYAYLVPASWDAASAAALNTLAGNYSSPTGKTYFWVTTTVANITTYAANKAIFATVPSPTQASTEHQAASSFYQWLVNAPSAASPVPPMAFRWAYGVTPWAQTTANSAAINTVLTAYGNLVLTGAEGGVSTACLFKGTTMDGEQAISWYAIDWLQIQIKLMQANTILNGSNSNPPLYYNQKGINSLLAVAQNECTSGISFGLLLKAAVTAQSFSSYTTANPAAYNAGAYGGFACTATSQLGFLTVTFNIDAVEFA